MEECHVRKEPARMGKTGRQRNIKAEKGKGRHRIVIAQNEKGAA